MTIHKVINSNSKDMYMLKDESVDLIVTSPPYPMVKMWDECFSIQNIEIEKNLLSGNGVLAFDLMHEVLNNIWSECDRVLKNGGFICINIGDATRSINNKFQMYSNHSKIISFFINKGYSILPDIIWHKQTNSPNKFMGSGMYPAGAYVTYEHEYILIFRKGGKRIFEKNEEKERKESAYFWEERNKWFSDIWEIKGTTQKQSNIKRKRSASYPFDIPYRLINMYSKKNDLILDPFGGLGTTSLAAMTSERNSIIFEIETDIINEIKYIMLNNIDMMNSIIDDRLDSHVKFIKNIEEKKCYLNENHNFKVKTKQERNIKINRISKIYNKEDYIICDYNDM